MHDTAEYTDEKEIVDQKAIELAEDFSYDGYQVVRRELFAHLREPAVVIRRDSVTFNTACIAGLEDAVYIQILVNQDNKRMVVRKCEENDKDALRWCVAKPDNDIAFDHQLIIAKLLDFNGDGVDELILAYQTEPSNIDNVEYTVELWEFDGTSVERVASQISWTGNNIPYFGGFSISKYEEKYLLVLTDNAGGDISYYGTKDDGSIGLVHELIWKGDAMEGDWYLDDEMISRETYEEYYNKYRSDSIWYGFSEESCNETIQEEISQTKDKLKM